MYLKEQNEEKTDKYGAWRPTLIQQFGFFLFN